MTQGAFLASWAGETIDHGRVLQRERLERVFTFGAFVYRFIYPAGVVSELYIKQPVKSAAAGANV
jgi:hypothetical protein